MKILWGNCEFSKNPVSNLKKLTLILKIIRKQTYSTNSNGDKNREQFCTTKYMYTFITGDTDLGPKIRLSYCE